LRREELNGIEKFGSNLAAPGMSGIGASFSLAATPGEGRFIKATADPQLGRRELVFLPEAV
jgi:hypothetical protein